MHGLFARDRACDAAAERRPRSDPALELRARHADRRRRASDAADRRAGRLAGGGGWPRARGCAAGRARSGRGARALPGRAHRGDERHDHPQPQFRPRSGAAVRGGARAQRLCPTSPTCSRATNSKRPRSISRRPPASTSKPSTAATRSSNLPGPDASIEMPRVSPSAAPAMSCATCYGRYWRPRAAPRIRRQIACRQGPPRRSG